MIISIIALIIWMLLYLVLFFIDARSILAPDHSLYVFLIYSAISSYCVFFKNIVLFSFFPLMLCPVILFCWITGHTGMFDMPFYSGVIIIIAAAIRGNFYESEDANAQLHPRLHNVVSFNATKTVNMFGRLNGIEQHEIESIKVEANNQTFVDMLREDDTFSNILHLSRERYVHKKRALRFIQKKDYSITQKSALVSALWALWDSIILIQSIDKYKEYLENEQKKLNEMCQKLK